MIGVRVRNLIIFLLNFGGMYVPTREHVVPGEIAVGRVFVTNDTCICTSSDQDRAQKIVAENELLGACVEQRSWWDSRSGCVGLLFLRHYFCLESTPRS